MTTDKILSDKLVVEYHGFEFDTETVTQALDSAYAKWSIHWDADGARFHVWIEKGEIGDCIYKNPPTGVRFGQSGHFNTRHLDMDKHPLIKAAIEAIPFEAYEAAWLAKRDARNAEQRKAADERRVKDIEIMHAIAKEYGFRVEPVEG